jgi:hypothetical protein
MPAGDGTGPWGQGPGTGWGRGGCVPFGTGRRFFGRGGGRGFGRGFGFARGFFGSPSSLDEAEYLKAEKAAIEEDKRYLDERLAELEKVQKKSGQK